MLGSEFDVRRMRYFLPTALTHCHPLILQTSPGYRFIDS